jgi:hypothetical protein
MGAAIGFVGADGFGRTVSRLDPLPGTGPAYRFSGLITRPANTDAYTAGDAIGTSTSAIITMPNMGPAGGFIQIQSVRLLNHVAAVPSGMGAFRLHLYSAQPTALADNAPWDLVAGDRAAYMDFIELPTPSDLGSTLFTKVDWPGALLKLADGSTTLWAILQTMGGFTPTANSTVYDLRVNAYEAGR